MPRPLMQHRIGQLEEMFAKGKADTKVLKQLERELQHRQVPRAVALLAEVQAAMDGGAPAEPPAAVPTPPIARPLFPSVQQPETAARSANPSTAQPPAIVQPRLPSVAPVPPEPPASPSMAMPVHDAYKLLKATPTSTWTSIEQTRRLLVQQAHPSHVASLSAEKRAQARAEAARVNAAYLRLSAVRCSG